MSEEKTELDQVQLETEESAEWAYRYGQEARLRADIEERYTALVYDMGILLGNINEALQGIAAKDEEWVKVLPNLIDNMFDSGCHIQYFLGKPVGKFKEDEDCQKAITGVKRQTSAAEVERTGTGEEMDKSVEKYLRARWDTMMKRFDEWITDEPPLRASYQVRKNANRNEKTEELVPLFIQLLQVTGHIKDAEELKEMVQKHTTH